MEKPDKHKTPEGGSLPGFVSRKAGTPSERDRKTLSGGEGRLDHVDELHDGQHCPQVLKTQQQQGQALLGGSPPLGAQYRAQDGASTSRRIEPESKTVLPLADGTAASNALPTADALIGL